jgi:drug/metabolite transporter (DMT)-like permease
MSLPVTAVVSTLTLHEHLSPSDWWALGAVTAGLVLVSLGSGEAGDVLVTPEFAGLLAAGLVVLVAVSLARHRVGGAGLGAIAGLGYSASAIAVRGVDTDVSLLVVVAALAVPSYSLVAFWLYSLGMDRAGVSAVTAPLIVLQTFVPALVGVWLLGDTVRDGWWPVVGCGLVLATAGAIGLSRPARSSGEESSSSRTAAVRRRSRGRASPTSGATGT